MAAPFPKSAIMLLRAVTWTRINGKMVASVLYEPEPGDTFADLRGVAEGMLNQAEGPTPAEPTDVIPEAVYKAAADHANTVLGRCPDPADIDLQDARVAAMTRHASGEVWSNAVRDYVAGWTAAKKGTV